jgi:toxin HigB-1
LTSNVHELAFVSVIASYGDEATRDVHYDDNTKAARAIPRNIWPVIRRELNQLGAATQLADLASPGNNLEKLKGDLAGAYSIHDQWRVVFVFEKGQADDVKITDYH